jgi:hypothetical protein
MREDASGQDSTVPNSLPDSQVIISFGPAC